jgi:glycosyltransferase involved in cell wall biosynthesis
MSPKSEPQQIRTLPPNPLRKGEGGLRTRGHWKTSRPGRPLVSIITVVLNGERHIEETIRSVFGQTYENVEYIVLDGGSTDGTINIIRRYEDSIDYWASERDEGVSDAFNKGISLSNGEIIGTINADDWYEREALDAAVRAFSDSGADIVSGAIQYWNGDKRDYVFFSNPSALVREMTVNHQTVFARKELYDRFGMFDTRYRLAMDYEVLLRFRLKGAGFHCLDNVLANMRLEGCSDRQWLRAYREVYEIKNSLMGNKARNYLYYLYTIFRRHAVSVLKKMGLSPLVSHYRRHYSIVKKARTK